ncbi:uncharacterized protein [Procambarus clarkii]|uniref:uncharacterized protein n=1 Tax=Procambarus clarkii TaxID=6728 RepID=UPI0037433BA4
MSDSDERDYGRGYNSDKRSSSSSSSNNRNAYGYGGGGYESSDSNKDDKYNSGYHDGGSWGKDDDDEDDDRGRGGYEFTYSDQGHPDSPGSDRGVFASCRRSKSVSSHSSKRSIGEIGGFEVSYHREEKSSDWSPKRCRKSRDSSSRSSSQESDRYRFRFGENDSDDEKRRKRKHAAAAASYLEEESGRTGHNDLPCCCVVL